MTTSIQRATSFEPEGVRFGICAASATGCSGSRTSSCPRRARSAPGSCGPDLFWSQVEPEPGRFVWDTVDALLAQLDGDEEVWITLCSSSPWATRQSTDFLPPSPAHDLRAYGEFVRRVVRRCAGRIRYWQCDNEPSNTQLLWAGTAEEYVAQLETMYSPP